MIHPHPDPARLLRDAATPEARALLIALWIEARGDVRRFLRSDAKSVGDHSIEAMTPGDANYPARLLDLEHPPVLFGEGDVPGGRSIAVVGSRAVDFEGSRLARQIVRDLASRGVVIVSGGAIGVDTLAHRAALAAGAPTVAFLPASFDKPTPRRNTKLFEEIAAGGGALLTEYPPGVRAARFHFRRRNDLIAAFADAVLVVRADSPSGTMLTARAASRLRRQLFAVPGSPEDDTSRGCLELIRAGDARCVWSADQIFHDLGWTFEPLPEQQSPSRPLAMSADATTVYQRLTSEPLHPDEVARRTDLPIERVGPALLELELTGAATRIRPGGRYVRSR